jgi:O-succinylbenzoate synthase
VREHFGDILLMGDANSAYTLDDIDLLKSLDEFDLMMLEQPLAHDDILTTRNCSKRNQNADLSGRTDHSPEDARKAIELEIAAKSSISKTVASADTRVKTNRKICRENSIPVWCGGMLESGIGRAHNIAMSTLAGFTLPGDVSASKRYWQEDIIEPAVEVTPQRHNHRARKKRASALK